MGADGNSGPEDDVGLGPVELNQQFQIIAVHGTNANDGRSRGTQWWQRGSDFSRAILEYLDTSRQRVVWVPYKWRGDNRERLRDAAGVQLGHDLKHRRPELPARIAMIGHSHGGNLCTRALAEQSREELQSISTICVGTPVLCRSYYISDALLSFSKYALLIALLLISGELLLASAGFGESLKLHERQIIVALAMTVPALVLFANLPVFGPAIERAMGFITRTPFIGRFLAGSKGMTRTDVVGVVRLYSEKDEAINSLMGMARKRWKIANATMTRPFFVFLVAAAGVGLLWLVQYEARWPIVLVFRDFAMQLGEALKCDQSDPRISNPVYCALTAQVNLYVPVSLAASLIVAIVLSRLGGAWLVAFGINLLFRFTILNGAYGLGTRFFNRWSASPNAEHLSAAELWKPLPICFDNFARAKVDEHASETLAAARDDIGVVAVMPSRSFLDAIRANIGWNELFHNIHFEDPNFQLFVAYILVDKFQFPPSERYRSISPEKRRECERWYRQIAPDDAEVVSANVAPVLAAAT
jgi:hypothetical protein